MKIDINIDKGNLNITLNEKFTFDDHMAFREIIKRFDETSISRIILHMSGVGFVDSAALGMLLLAAEAAKKHKKELVIRGASGQVRKMFEMAKFDKILTME